MSPSASAEDDGPHHLVYVDEVTLDQAASAQDTSALTSGLCAAMAKDKRIEVLCAPDVKQVLRFAATAAMLGTAPGPGGGAASSIEERLAGAKSVVSASLKKKGARHVLLVRAGPTAKDAPPTALYTDEPILTFEHEAATPLALLDAMPTLAARVTAALVSAERSPPPPPPLSPAGGNSLPSPAGGGKKPSVPLKSR